MRDLDEDPSGGCPEVGRGHSAEVQSVVVSQVTQEGGVRRLHADLNSGAQHHMIFILSSSKVPLQVPLKWDLSYTLKLVFTTISIIESLLYRVLSKTCLYL